jgi:hypothetical protein
VRTNNLFVVGNANPETLQTAGRRGPGGGPIEIYFDDWRTVDGIKYPLRISQSSGNLTLGFTINKIRHNIDVDANLFELQR